METTTPNLQARYDRLLHAVLVRGAWLCSPRASLLPEATWKQHFEEYTADLRQLRRLGDELRPVSLPPVCGPLGSPLGREIDALITGEEFDNPFGDHPELPDLAGCDGWEPGVNCAEDEETL